MTLPSVKEVEALHRKYAPNDEAFDVVWQHVCIVAEIARSLIDSHPDLKVDQKLVEIGCLVHDIGVYELVTSGTNVDVENLIKHGVIGYKILKDEGYPEIVSNFARNHTGVGITKEDVISLQLPIPQQDYIPRTTEEKLVAYADTFHSKSNGGVFNSVEYYRQRLASRFGKEKVKIFDEFTGEFGAPDLQPIMGLFHYSPDRIRLSF